METLLGIDPMFRVDSDPRQAPLLAEKMSAENDSCSISPVMIPKEVLRKGLAVTEALSYNICWCQRASS